MSVSAQKVGAQDDKKCQYGDACFKGEPVNLNIVNMDIRDILSYITEQYGINFVIDKSVPAVPVTVNLSEIPWNEALDAILSSQELGAQTKGRILRIAQSKTLAEEASQNAQIANTKLDNSPLYTEFIRLNYSRASGTLASSATGGASQFTGGTQTGSVANAGGATGAASGGGNGLLPIIKRRLSRRGAIEIDDRSNTLIITDVRENIDAVRQLVALLDQPEPQVEIEARIVIASRDFSRDLGVQLSGLVFGKNGNAASAGTLPGTPGGKPNPNGAPGTVINSPNNTLASQIVNTAIGLTTGIFGTAQISMAITMGERQGQAKTIATPRITTLNNKSATIESGQQIPVVTTQTSSSGSGGGPIFTTTYVSVPLKLSVTPQITDVGTVLLNVVTENNSLSSTVAVGGNPAINTQRMQTEVMVPDGGTTVVGGALVDVEGEDKFRTPGISKIPIIGNLFKRKAVARSTNEILFFITPRIYRPDYEGNPIAAKASDGPRTTTIIQPVPLGNPPSNSGNQTPDPSTQQPTVQLVQAAPSSEPAKQPAKP